MPDCQTQRGSRASTCPCHPCERSLRLLIPRTTVLDYRPYPTIDAGFNTDSFELLSTSAMIGRSLLKTPKMSAPGDHDPRTPNNPSASTVQKQDESWFALHLKARLGFQPCKRLTRIRESRLILSPSGNHGDNAIIEMCSTQVDR